MMIFNKPKLLTLLKIAVELLAEDHMNFLNDLQQQFVHILYLRPYFKISFSSFLTWRAIWNSTVSINIEECSKQTDFLLTGRLAVGEIGKSGN